MFEPINKQRKNAIVLLMLVLVVGIFLFYSFRLTGNATVDPCPQATAYPIVGFEIKDLPNGMRVPLNSFLQVTQVVPIGQQSNVISPLDGIEAPTTNSPSPQDLASFKQSEKKALEESYSIAFNLADRSAAGYAQYFPKPTLAENLAEGRRKATEICGAGKEDWERVQLPYLVNCIAPGYQAELEETPKSENAAYFQWGECHTEITHGVVCGNNIVSRHYYYCFDRSVCVDFPGTQFLETENDSMYGYTSTWCGCPLRCKYARTSFNRYYSRTREFCFSVVCEAGQTPQLDPEKCSTTLGDGRTTSGWIGEMISPEDGWYKGSFFYKETYSCSGIPGSLTCKINKPSGICWYEFPADFAPPAGCEVTCG